MTLPLEWRAHVRKVSQHAVQAVREPFGRRCDSLQDAQIAIQIEELLHEITPTVAVLEEPAIGSQSDSAPSEKVAAVAVALADDKLPEPEPEPKPEPEPESAPPNSPADTQIVRRAA